MKYIGGLILYFCETLSCVPLRSVVTQIKLRICTSWCYVAWIYFWRAGFSEFKNCIKYNKMKILIDIRRSELLTYILPRFGHQTNSSHIFISWLVTQIEFIMKPPLPSTTPKWTFSRENFHINSYYQFSQPQSALWSDYVQTAGMVFDSSLEGFWAMRKKNVIFGGWECPKLT